MFDKIKFFLEDESGATAIEYALIALMISTAVIGGATATGTSLGNRFNSVAGSF